jgi:molecular chaperone HtpG
MQEKGKIAVHSENIFPIIKRFLYADHDVFLRELVANAVDATQKLKQLATLGEFDGELSNDPIRIIINETLKTITISDHGIGMSAEEVKKVYQPSSFFRC